MTAAHLGRLRQYLPKRTRVSDSMNDPLIEVNDAPIRTRRSRQVEPVFMDTNELSAILGMSSSWVYREAEKLGLTRYKLGHGKNAKVLYKRAEVFRWIEQQRMH
ncbi:helix-turn-helix domain-containing protein [Streptomyces sp. NPDC059991]|uniref:helix-turn-helix domain-containing protein n=1 Tax=Streptomyces sp. NPDC059991 TaxID=3347028 RepID=UPI0036811627